VAQALPAARQRMKHDQAEVSRLQREVARQESDSLRASQRLQQQDQQIAALHRELAKLRNGPAAGQP
jgi:chromosome segregation ATPase